MRMRIAFARPPVRRPARVGNAERPAKRFGRQSLGEPLHMSDRAHDPKRALIEHGDSRRVIAAILQPPESAQQNVRGWLGPDIPHDATHDLSPSNYWESG